MLKKNNSSKKHVSKCPGCYNYIITSIDDQNNIEYYCPKCGHSKIYDVSKNKEHLFLWNTLDITPINKSYTYISNDYSVWSITNLYSINILKSEISYGELIEWLAEDKIKIVSNIRSVFDTIDDYFRYFGEPNKDTIILRSYESVKNLLID